MRLNFLGSGTSHGIPVIGCGCPVCRSPDPRDARMRASLYIQGNAGERAVIDTGPEFRIQALRAGIIRLDAALLTHAHADHIHGLDDVRPLCWETPLAIYGNALTISEMRERFAYVFKETQRGGGKPRLLPIVVSAPFSIGGITIIPIPVKHGCLDILGWKIRENTAGTGRSKTAVYITDVSGIPPSSRELIRRPDLLIIGGLREHPHETHFSFEEALTAAAGLEARRVYLTHISHNHLHREIEDYCRAFGKSQGLEDTFMGPGYDGLEVGC